jgi:ribose transport system ATP-binding protein
VTGSESGLAPRLAVVGLSKAFGVTRALDKVSLTVQPAEIHAVIGQNGSGKSTLVKVMSGYHRADAGTVAIDGHQISMPFTPRLLRQYGLSVVHQDLGLIDNLTVAENIRIASFFNSKIYINWQREAETAAATLVRLKADISATALVSELAPSERAMVAIARALQTESEGIGDDRGGLILLDESTRALPKHALESFYETLHLLRESGTSILMVSHNLIEVLAVADRVSIFRDGRVVGENIAAADVTETDLARLMLGSELKATLRTRSGPQERGTPKVVIRGLQSSEINDLDIAIEVGEIVGATGLPGAGHEQLPYVLAGSTRATAGTCDVNSKRINLASTNVKAMIQRGVVLVPERRAEEGLALQQSVQDNITLPRLASHGRRFSVGERWQRNEGVTAVQRLGIRPARPDLLAANLSGGNQQKVLMAKWLLNEPELLLLHEPTQGVDIGARHDLLTLVGYVANAGCSVLISSGEPDDLIAICDRVLIFRDGAVVDTLLPPYTKDAILEALYGHIEAIV